MYYNIFDNWEKIYELLKNKQFKELEEEFAKSKIIKLTSYNGVHPSAKETYRSICQDIINSCNEEMLKRINEYAVDMFVESKDIDALVMIHDEPRVFGAVSQAAMEILEEFYSDKAVAMNLFEKNSEVDSFDEEIGAIRVIRRGSRLSFIKDGVEHIIFYK